MIKIKNYKGVKVIIGLLFAALALMITVSPSFAAAIDDRTWITNQAGGQIAAAGNLRFIAYYKGLDDYIQTEDSWNAIAGYANSNAGYTLGGAPAKGWCDTNASYYPDPDPASTDTYDIWISSIADAQAVHTSGTVGALTPNAVPVGNGNGTPLALSAANYLAEPGNTLAYPGNARAVIRWNAVTGATGYKVYRGPVTGVGVGAGIYQKIADTTSLSTEDATVANGTTYYYIVVAYDATRRGVHTNQLSTTPTVGTDPAINAPTPTSATISSPITISGTNFGSSHGTIEFNGAQVTSGATWSDTSITVTVPVGVTAGKLYIVNATTGRVSNGWSYTIAGPVPNIASLSPGNGVSGTTVTINGTNFGAIRGSSTVAFNGTLVTSYTSWSDTQIQVPAPVGGTTGNVIVTVGSPSNGYAFTYNTPSITTVNPASGNVGDTVTITGSNFGTVTAGGRSSTANHVTLGATQLTDVQVTAWTNTSITAVIPSIAKAGSYNFVITAGGNTSGTSAYTVTPEITSVTGGPYYIGNTSITINGSAFGSPQGTSTITVGGQNLSVASWNATQITGTLPNNISAGAQNVVVTVINSGSYTSNPGSITCDPYISGLVPTSGKVGDTVTIEGYGFGATEGTSAITFNGTTVITYDNWSNTSVQVKVPTGATTGNVVLTVNPGAYASNGQTFTVTAPSTGGQLIYEKAGGIMMAYPNPFNPDDKANPLKMLFNTATGEAVDIYIFDTNARMIWQRRNSDPLAADRTVTWDGETSYGEVVENGLYLIRVVKDGKLVAKGKILVIKK